MRTNGWNGVKVAFVPRLWHETPPVHRFDDYSPDLSFLAGARLDYNKNLVALLRGLADEDRIRIDLEQRDVSGDNPFNPTSVIRWTKT